MLDKLPTIETLPTDSFTRSEYDQKNGAYVCWKQTTLVILTTGSVNQLYGEAMMELKRVLSDEGHARKPITSSLEINDVLRIIAVTQKPELAVGGSDRIALVNPENFNLKENPENAR